MKKYLPFQFYKGGTESATLHLPEGSLGRIGRGYVRDIALSPDGSLLVAASDLGLWWYDVSTRSLLTLWEVGTSVESVAFSNCGQWIATGGSKGSSINVWDVINGNCLIELARVETGCNSEIVFSPDRKHLAVCGSWRDKKDYFSVEVYSLPATPQVNKDPVHLESTYTYAGYLPLAFSPDGTLLTFGAPTGVPLPFHTEGSPICDKNRGLSASNIAVCDVRRGQHLTTLDGFNDVGSVCFSPDGRFVAGGDSCGQIRVWLVPEDFSPDKCPWHLHKVYEKKDNETISCVVDYLPEGALITVERNLDDTLSVRAPEQGETLYKHSKDNIHYRAYFSKGTSLAFAGNLDVHVWTLGDNHATTVSQLHAFPPHALHFSLDGKRLLAMERWDGIFSWDVTYPEQPPSIFKPIGNKTNSDAAETYLSLDISPEGKQFVTSSDKNTIRLWEVDIDTPLAAFAVQEEVSDATFSPTANLIACRDTANQIYIYDVATGKLRDTYKGVDRHRPTDFSFSPNGAYLSYGPCHLYDVAQREQIESFIDDHFQFIAFSPDSAHFWDTGSPDTIELWDIRRCEEVLTLYKPEAWKQREVHTVLASACGRYLACSPIMYENDVSVSLGIYDIHKGTAPIATFEVPGPYASDTLTIAFSPDNTLLASSGEDGTILLWDMKPYL